MKFEQTFTIGFSLLMHLLNKV